MRKFIFLLASASLLFACNSGMSPVEYNDVIVGEQSKITQLFIESSTYVATDLDKANAIREKTIIQCDSSIARVSKLGDFKGDTKFRDAGLALFKFYKNINTNEYKEMIEILQKDDIGVEDIEKMTALQTGIGEQEAVLDENLRVVQNDFAKKNNIQIAPNALQKKIDAL